MKSRLLGGMAAVVTLTIALVTGATPANAVEGKTHTLTTATSTKKAALFTDADIVKLLLFGTGPIAAAKPELVTNLNITPQPDVPQQVVDQIVAGLLQVDPAFHQKVTLNAQAGDPYKAEKSVTYFVDDVKALSSKVNGTTGTGGASAKATTANGWLWAFSNVAVSTQVALTAAIAVSVIAVAGALVVFAYQQPADSSDLAMQNWAAGLTGL